MITDRGFWTDPRYELISRMVRDRAGLHFEQRPGRAEAGIKQAMKKAGITDITQYQELIDRDKDEFDQLIIELTVGETYFYREPDHFRFIREVIIPDIQKRRGSRHIIRMWSAGCSSGEEPYSLAMMFEELGLGDHLYLLATDISLHALSKCRRGVYDVWSLRGDGAEKTQTFLERKGESYIVGEAIKEKVIFAHHNLALDSYPSLASGIWGMDIIMCRNVLIYFDQETIDNIARRFYESLTPEGWLIMGPSDPPLHEAAPFEVVVTDYGVFYRKTLEEKGGVVMGVDGTPIGTPIPADPEAGELSSYVSESVDVESSIPTPDSVEVAKEPDEVARDPEKTVIENARAAFEGGDYPGVIDLIGEDFISEESAVLCVRALANLSIQRALEACEERVSIHTVSAELNYLLGLLKMNVGKEEDAVEALKKAIFLDRNLIVAHFTLGTLLQRAGDIVGARRHFRNARDLCIAMPDEEAVPLADGERAGRLAEAAQAQMDLIKS